MAVIGTSGATPGGIVVGKNTFGFGPGQTGLNVGGVQAPIAPQIETTQDIGELVSRFQSRLAKAQPTVLTPESAATAFAAQRPTAITGRAPEAFELERLSAVERLREEFLGAGGKAEQALSQESAAGRLGSGVGGRIIQQTIAEPLVEQQRLIGRDVRQAQLAEEARVQEFNVQQKSQFDQTFANLLAQDSKNELLASQANAELQAGYDELAVKLANVTTERELNLLELEIRNFEAATDKFRAVTGALTDEGQLELEQAKLPLPEGGEVAVSSELIPGRRVNVNELTQQFALENRFFLPPENNFKFELVQDPDLNGGEPTWIDTSGQQAWDAANGRPVDPSGTFPTADNVIA